jgi:hypothetical protein
MFHPINVSNSKGAAVSGNLAQKNEYQKLVKKVAGLSTGPGGSESDPVFLSQKGVAGGVATLDLASKIPLAQLPNAIPASQIANVPTANLNPASTTGQLAINELAQRLTVEEAKSTITKKGNLPTGGTKATPLVINAASMPLSVNDGDYYTVATVNTATANYYNLNAIGYGIVNAGIGAKISFNATQNEYTFQNAGENQTASEVSTTPVVASATTIADSSTNLENSKNVILTELKKLDNKVDKPVAGTAGYVATVNATGDGITYVAPTSGATPNTQAEVTAGTVVGGKYVQPDTLKVELDKKASAIISTGFQAVGSENTLGLNTTDTLQTIANKLNTYVATPEVKDNHVSRANTTTGVAPTLIEVPAPTAGFTAKVNLSNGTTEFYTYNGTAWILNFTQLPVTLDGNHQTFIRSNSTANVAPTALEIPAPINGDSAYVYLQNGNKEIWAYSTAWTLVGTIAAATLDGNTVHLTSATTTGGVAPTNVEIVAPQSGDTAIKKLSNNNIEFWSYNGTAWVLDFTTISNKVIPYTTWGWINPGAGTVGDEFSTAETNDTAIKLTSATLRIKSGTFPATASIMKIKSGAVDYITVNIPANQTVGTIPCTIAIADVPAGTELILNNSADFPGVVAEITASIIS